MLLGHLLFGVLFGALLAVACLVSDLSVLTALEAYIIGGNVGFVASLGAPPS